IRFLQATIRDGHQILRHGHADLHTAIGFVSTVILVGPPDARADSLARRNDEWLAEIVSAPRYAPDPRRILTDSWHAFIKHLDLIFDSLRQLLLKHYPVDVSFTLEFELLVAVCDLRDCQRRLQVDLHLAAGFESLESDLVGSFQTPRVE